MRRIFGRATLGFLELSERMKQWIEIGYDPVTGVNPPFNDPIPEPFRNLSPERSHVSKRVSFGTSDRAFRTVPTFAIEDAPFTDRENSRSTTVYKKGPLRGRRKVPLCDRFRGRLARKLECLDVTPKRT